ncbi:reverse transcriptase [Corchorus capsularis]|uniref:Reverse transcriptase n=1 Tax=Corchorus capsularis TaxID=210143 RepID=A0A1R3K499_COCAP|nr:reverse transcriptase [Corchorus capsularis]
MVVAWRVEGAFMIKEAGDNLFIFHFEDEIERDRVLVSQPWCFNRALLVLKDFDGIQDPNEVVFDQCQYWMRMFDLPIMLMNMRIGVSVGETMGPVLEVDDTNGRFLRVRVVLNLSTPLKKTTTATTSQGEVLVRFKYEKLPAFCRVCGLLTHLDNDCPVGVTMLKTQGVMDKQYDNSIRAEIPDVKPRQSGLLAHSRLGILNPVVGNRGGFNQAPVSSVSGSSQPRALRNHVDNQLLRQQQAARGRSVRAANDEAISRSGGRFVPQIQGGLGNVEGQLNRSKVGIVGSSSIPQQEQGMKFMAASFAAMRNWRGKEKEVAGISPLMEGIGESSPNGGGFFQEVFQGPNNVEGGQSIPGVGPAQSGPAQDAQQQQHVAQDSLQHKGLDQRAEDFIPLQAGSNSPPTFVFGATTPPPVRRHRKWKKTARVTSKYLFDVLGPAANVDQRVGQKRNPGIPNYEFLNIGANKRSKERAMEQDDQEEDEFGAAIYRDLGPVARPTHATNNGASGDTKMEWIRCRIGYDCCFSVGSVGRSGGLAMLWNNEIAVSIVSYSNLHIDITVGNVDSEKWRFTGFYGRPETNKRHESWALLRLLATQSNLPWLCADDFNEILSNDEKLGGRMRSQRQMNDFREVIDECCFNECPTKGPTFTWSRRFAGEVVFEKLDRAYATISWSDRFMFSHVQTMIHPGSDHLPLLITVLDKVPMDFRSRKNFRFEHMWIKHDGLEELIKESWNQNLMLDVKQYIEACGRALQFWDKSVFGNVKHKINYKKRELEKLYGEIQQQDNPLVIQDWKRKNLIVAIQGEDGTWQSDRMVVEGLFVEYFRSLFSTSSPDVTRIHAVTGLLDRRIDSDMCLVLDRDFTKEEIKQAAFAMDPDKAAGLDDMSPLFFQRFWHIVGDKIGFSEKWILMVMNCVTTVSYSFLINGTYSEKFKPTRGIRQGDPLSPYLFLLCMEGLSSLLLNAERSGAIGGIAITRGAPRVSHLFFADDCLLFLRATLMECDNVLDVLKVFEEASAVAQAVPTYLMSCFKFPKTFLHELNQMIARFWWGGDETRRKIHWKNWADLCVSKLDGGLGFRDFKAFNLALLAKQCCRIIHNENSLCSRLLKAKYFRDRTFMSATLGANPSFLWRSLLAGRDVIKLGSRWRVGNGSSIEVWTDNWLNKAINLRPQARTGVACQPIKHGTTNGHYTVKSGYYVARNLLGKESPVVEDRQAIWRRIWGATIQPKVKFFLWRGWLEEADFWDCVLNKASLLGSLELVTYLLWSIWHNRNKSLHEFVCKMPGSICAAARIRVAKVVKLQQQHDRIRQSECVQRWSPPIVAQFKINTDASFDLSSGEAGLGAVVRDSQGSVLISATARINKVPDPLFAEVYAVRFGLIIARLLGLQSCELECDSMLAVREINNVAPVLWEGGVLIQQIRMLGSSFNLCSCQHVNRCANMFAHNLARIVREVGAYVTWCGDNPLPVCNPDH